MNKYIGETYGIYTIIDILPNRDKSGHLLYKGKCVCGEFLCAPISYFNRHKNKIKCSHYVDFGNIKVKTNLINNKRISHIYYHILSRCYNKSDVNYKWYGDRGVTVCQEWVDNPKLFEQWALSNGYADNLTIDRLDESKEYSPDNCRWIDKTTNARYKSSTNYITATVTLSGRQWAKLIPNIGINYINSLYREQGEEITVKFIESKLCDKHKLF